MESPHVIFARWIDSLLSENKELVQKAREEAAKEFQVQFVSETESFLREELAVNTTNKTNS